MNYCARCGRPSAGLLCTVCGGARPRPLPATTARANLRRLEPSSSGAASALRQRVPSRTGQQMTPDPPGPAPAPDITGPAAPGRVRPGGSVGEVVSTPAVSPGRPGFGAALRALVLPLAILAVLTNPSLVRSLLLIVIAVIAVLWLAGRLGLGGIEWLSLLLAMLRRGGASSRWVPPAMTFRCASLGAVRSVQLVGHDTGVQLGDQVDVRGVTITGTVRAVRVTNLTTGAVLLRHGMVRLAVLALLDVGLGTTVLVQILGR